MERGPGGVVRPEQRRRSPKAIHYGVAAITFLGMVIISAVLYAKCGVCWQPVGREEQSQPSFLGSKAEAKRAADVQDASGRSPTSTPGLAPREPPWPSAVLERHSSQLLRNLADLSVEVLKDIESIDGGDQAEVRPEQRERLVELVGKVAREAHTLKLHEPLGARDTMQAKAISHAQNTGTSGSASLSIPGGTSTTQVKPKAVVRAGGGLPYFVAPEDVTPRREVESPSPMELSSSILVLPQLPFTEAHPRALPTLALNLGGQPSSTRVPAQSRSAMGTTVVEAAVSPTLFCYGVIFVGRMDTLLMEVHLQRRTSIFGCHAFSIFSDGNETLGMGPWGSVDVIPVVVSSPKTVRHNIDVFASVWRLLQQDTTYLHYDWTVKADADTVFLPGLLQKRLLNKQLFQGIVPTSPIYLATCQQGFSSSLQGPLEVLSSVAAQKLFVGVQGCLSFLDWRTRGEAWFVSHCLDSLLTEKREGLDLLDDSSCGEDDPVGSHHEENGFQGPPCTSGKPAFHPFQTAEDIENCIGDVLPRMMARE